METRSRDPASWLPLAEGVSSRNLVFTFYLSTVNAMMKLRHSFPDSVADPSGWLAEALELRFTTKNGRKRDV